MTSRPDPTHKNHKVNPSDRKYTRWYFKPQEEYRALVKVNI